MDHMGAWQELEHKFRAESPQNRRFLYTWYKLHKLAFKMTSMPKKPNPRTTVKLEIWNHINLCERGVMVRHP